MALFKSKRERILWTWILIIQLSIYLTLGLSPKLSGMLRSNGLLEPAFLLAFILIGLSLIVLGLKQKRGRQELGIIVGVLAAYILVFVRMEMPEERTHLIEYSVVAALIFEALNERLENRWSMFSIALSAILITSIFGSIDEGIQQILPNRVFDVRDILFNLLASVMAVSAILFLKWVRNNVNSNNNFNDNT